MCQVIIGLDDSPNMPSEHLAGPLHSIPVEVGEGGLYASDQLVLGSTGGPVGVSLDCTPDKKNQNV